MAQPVIQAVGLTKVYRDFWRRARVWAVRDLDLEVEPGEVFGLLGPNGSGKSTTIKLMLGLLHSTRGRISVFGAPPDSVLNKRRIGYLPEETYLYRFLNAREMLDYYGTLFQLPRRERKRRVEELLEMVGLLSAARRPVGEYSKGMARRIGLAQALINDPDLLILDEPTSGLDPIGSDLVKDIIARLGAVHHKTIILSSHLLADVEEVCSRVAILFGGRVRVAGTMSEVLDKADLQQLTFERMSDSDLAEVRSMIAQRTGKAPAVGTPRERLAELFVQIVREAQAQRAETGGARNEGQFAGFLDGQAPTTDEVVRELVEPTPAATPHTPDGGAASSRPAVKLESVEQQERDSVLSQLTDEAPDSAEQVVRDAGEAEAEVVDRGLLDDLTAGGQPRSKDKS